MKRNFGVKAKLLTSFIAFSLLVIALLWLLEVVFLDDIYRAIKINSVRNTAQQLRALSDEEMEASITEAAASIGLCASIYDPSLKLLAEEHSGGQCVVHNLSLRTVALFYESTLGFENRRFESLLPADEIKRILQRNDVYDDRPNSFLDRFFDNRPALSASNDAYDCVLYSVVFENDQGLERYALISAILLPVESTVQTIRLELNILIGLLILISVVMAVVLSRTISRPIVLLNNASKRLPEGYFDGGGIKGYREVEELAETLSRSAEEIGQVDNLRKELIANVSHDLRTPLTLISAYSEMMRDIPGENTPENLQAIIDESARLSTLVTDLMDLSKLEAGMQELSRERIELVSFIKGILQRYEKMTSFQGYSFSFESSREALFVEADPVKLNQIVYNLINNAIHYCGKDRFVGVRLVCDENEAVVEVMDHGEGIPAEQLSKIWDRYYRVDRNHRSSVVGSGLGLSIVKKLLELHNARFGVKSEEGQGTVFWFALHTVDRE